MRKIACIVEGRGEIDSVPLLIRRIGEGISESIDLQVVRPFFVPRHRLLKDDNELERYVDLAAREVGSGGALLIMFDSDDDCPVELAASVLRRAQACRSDLLISVVAPVREYEAWFLAAAESLRGIGGLASDLTAPENPESIRGAKEWLSARMTGKRYAPTVDQARFTYAFDIGAARNTRSFIKLHKEVSRLLVE